MKSKNKNSYPLLIGGLAIAFLGWGRVSFGGPNGAALTGTVVLKGTPPTVKKLQMSADPQCRLGHTKAPVEENYVVGPKGELANVLVYVKSGLEGKTIPAPTKKARLEQKGCQYKPHVIGVQVDQEIEIINDDQTLHNVNARPKDNRPFNFAQPVQGMKTTKKFSKPELLIPLKCDIHPWMKSYIHVVGNPYFSVSNEEGQFQIQALPAGTYTIEAVHEELGSITKEITVKDGESKTLQFVFNAAK